MNKETYKAEQKARLVKKLVAQNAEATRNNRQPLRPKKSKIVKDINVDFGMF